MTQGGRGVMDFVTPSRLMGGGGEGMSYHLALGGGGVKLLSGGGLRGCGLMLDCSLTKFSLHFCNIMHVFIVPNNCNISPFISQNCSSIS